MAQRGRKPDLPAVKDLRGTQRKSRDIHEVLPSPSGEVLRPDGMPLDAQIIWDDFAPTAIAMGTLKPADALVFAQWCVMGANITASWSCTPPAPAPAAYVSEWRKIGELFGLTGEKSRMVLKITDSKSANPFAKHGRA